MPVTIEPSNHAPDDSRDGPQAHVSASAEIPAWLAARRERVPAAVAPTEQPAASSSPLLFPSKKSKTTSPVFPMKVDTGKVSALPQNGQEEWFSKQGMIGVGVSLLVHAVVLLILACFIVSQVSKTEMTTIWGMQGNSDEFQADLVLDSELPNDGGESSPLQMTEASQTLNSLGNQGDIAESMRVGLGGKGNGEGDSGEGMGSGVGALKVPGHAQTKGSFSAWADPRDPKPDQDYEIVIQIKLPGDVKKLRGSDITGNVIGTDSYRQAIRFKPNDLLPVVGGMVQLRVPVPGAHRLVRDTIRIESKILREKQVFEIEF